MAIPLPPDPYKALGIEPTALEGDVRKVYLKLVLKCHPDKIQDPTLRAQKTDEFHKIQEAWDLLSDKTKRDDYDEKVKMNARSNAMRGSAGASRQTRSGGYPSPTPAGQNVYDFQDATNAHIYTAEPRDRDSRRRREPSPARVYAQYSSKTRSYGDELLSRYDDDEPRMRKSASAEHPSRKSAGATMERERRRGDEDRDRYEKDRKKKEYSASQKTRDREKRSRTEEKTSRKTFIVDDSPEEYDSHRPSRKADRGGSVLQEEFDKMHISSRYGNGSKEADALQYISESRSRVKGVPPAAVPSAPPAVKVEEFRPRGMPRAETFSTYSVPQPHRPYYDDEEAIHRSAARPSSRRPSADAASPRSSDPMSPRIVTAEPPFARNKPSLQHHNSAPPIFVDRMPLRSQTLQPEVPRRPSPGTVPSMPRRAETFNDKYSSPLKQSHRPLGNYSDDSSSSDSDAEPYSRPQPVKKPSAPKVYTVGKSGPKYATLVKEVPHFVRKRSSSPHTLRSPDRPSMSSRSTGSTVRSKLPSQQSSRYYDDTPSVRVSKREAPTSSRSGGDGYFYGEVPPVNYAPPYDPADMQYSPYERRGSSGMPTHAYHSRREAVN